MSDGTGTPTRAQGDDDATAQIGEDAARPAVHLHVPAVPANVALARQALAGLAEHLGVAPVRIADMKVALTEACTNAVVHAYGDEGGPLDVTMGVEHDRLVLTVRDRGHGLHPLPSPTDGPGLGFGLALIASLSDEFGIAGGRHGTEVRVAFALGPVGDAPPLVVRTVAEEPWPANETVLTLTHGDHAGAVLSRVVALVAARADFSIDRLSDAQIVSDAIAGAAASSTPDDAVRVAIDEHEDGFDLVVGPLLPGGGERLIDDTELPGLGRLLERLTDLLAVELLPAADAGEQLRARLRPRN